MVENIFESQNRQTEAKESSFQDSSEIAWVRELMSSYPRSNQQLNRPFYSDAEIIQVRGGFVTVSIDTVAEEFRYDILRDPESLGWLTVTASLSDLAACGVSTQSVSVHLGHPDEIGKNFWITKFNDGCRGAAQAVGAAITEFHVYPSANLISSATAMSFQKSKPKLTRENFAAGSALYVTGPVGWGNAVALANVALRSFEPDWVAQLDKTYRPTAKTQEGLFLNDWAEACIDTSDGLMFTLDLMSEILGCGFRIDWSNELIHPLAHQVAQAAKVPPSLFFAGQNGEFELLFSVRPDLIDSFEAACTRSEMKFLKIGEVIRERQIEIYIPAGGTGTPNRTEVLDLRNVRNLLHSNIDPQSYVAALIGLVSQHGF